MDENIKMVEFNHEVNNRYGAYEPTACARRPLLRAQSTEFCSG